MSDANVPSNARFWLTERVLLGSFTLGSFTGLTAYVIHKADALQATASTAVLTTIIATALGALGTAVGMVIQGVFRTDKAEKDNAAAAFTLAAKMPHHPLNGGTPEPTPVNVVNPPEEPVPTAPQEPTDNGTTRPL